jgi:peptidoglycan/xylan/chitin deacetylase (PgdA/CDA1 family)
MNKKMLIFITLTILITMSVFTSSNSTVKAASLHGLISITFDDGNQNQFDYAYPMLQARGMVGTFYVITDRIGLNGNMSYGELQTLQANGNEIGSHSVTHSHMIQMSSASIIQELSVSKQTLQSHGLTVNNFAYPYGETNDTVDSYVSQYYRSGRTYVNDFRFLPVPVPDYTNFPNFYQPYGYVSETGDNTVLSRLKSAVDNIPFNGWTVFTFHNVVPDPSISPYAISTTDFAAFLDYILSKDIPTVTINQALNLGLTMSLTMATNYGAVLPTSGLYAPGSNVTITANSPNNETGKQYVFLGWTGAGIGSYSGLNNPASVVMTDNITEIALWKIQYDLTVTSSRTSTPSSGSHWYDAGSSVTAYVTTPVSGGTGVRDVSLGWSGTGSVPADGTASAVTFTINEPSTLTWNWQTQYYLTVTSPNGTASGTGWYPAGTTQYASVTPTTVPGSTGTQFVFINWSGDASGNSSPSNPIVMSGPKTATANWEKQYYLTVSSAHGTTGGAGWYAAGGSATATIDSLTIPGDTGVQYVMTGWSENASGNLVTSNPITMTGPKTAIPKWQTQYNITVAQLGLGSDVSGTVLTVNGTNYGIAGFTVWANASDVYAFSYTPQLVITPNGKQCLLTGLTGNSTNSVLTASAPATVIGTYKTQYYLTSTSTYGTPSPIDGWYDSGSSVSGFVASPVNVNSTTQYVCSGWSGSGSVPTTGSVSAITFTINATSNIAWNWKTQYLVSFVVDPSSYGTTAPSGTNVWQDAGSISISASATYGYRFSSWSSNTTDITFQFGTSSSTTATINGPGTITAVFVVAPAPTATPTPSRTPSPTASPSPTSVPTAIPTATPSSTPTKTPGDTSNSINSSILYGGIVAAILAGVIIGIVAFKKLKK